MEINKPIIITNRGTIEGLLLVILKRAMKFNEIYIQWVPTPENSQRSYELLQLLKYGAAWIETKNEVISSINEKCEFFKKGSDYKNIPNKCLKDKFKDFNVNHCSEMIRNRCKEYERDETTEPIIAKRITLVKTGQARND